jgi:hypothetical protein
LIGGGWSLLEGIGTFSSRSGSEIDLSLLGALVLIMGINRWTCRVITYSALLTDSNPPFRLDLGGAEPVASDTGEMPAAPRVTR